MPNFVHGVASHLLISYTVGRDKLGKPGAVQCDELVASRRWVRDSANGLQNRKPQWK